MTKPETKPKRPRGRPRSTGTVVTATTRFDPPTLAALDRLAADERRARADVLRVLIGAVDDLRDLAEANQCTPLEWIRMQARIARARSPIIEATEEGD